MLYKSIRVETRETEDEEAVKVLSAIFAFFPLIFYNAVDRHWSSLVGDSYQITWNGGFGFCSSLFGFCISLHCFSFLPFFFVDPVDRQMPCAPDKDFFWEWEQCCSNPKHHLRQTYSLPLLPWERFSSSPLQEGGEKRETGEDSLEGGERERLVGTSRMLKFRLGSASPLWSH